MSNIEKLKEKFLQGIRSLQRQIQQELLNLDPSLHFHEDNWKRKSIEKGNEKDKKDEGGGLTLFFEQGKIIESAGVNTSLVYGPMESEMFKTIGGEGPLHEFWATGISVIIHPRNPHIPTTHMNFRMILAGTKIWFGGGADLTPYYPYPEDFSFFHQTWKNACDSQEQYTYFKENCDQYFSNKHREGEMRGVGGIFFDHFLKENVEKSVEFSHHLSSFFIPSYFPLAYKHRNKSWTSQEEEFQLFRRGRYVEFNLIHDRGTLFGLKTKGRTQSILVSLPTRCTFHYTPPVVLPWQEEMMSYYWPRNWA